MTAKVIRAVSRAIDRARPRIVSLVTARGEAAAAAAVPKFAARYRSALRETGAVTVTSRSVTILIRDPVVVGVERGLAAHDMKPKLLARGRPSKSGGMYVDVVLRHKPGSVPQAMRTAGRRAARSSGGVGELRMSRVTAGKSFTRQLHRGPRAQAVGFKPRAQAVNHKRGVHDDLIRSSFRRARNTVSVRYSTIRRVSSSSDPSSWWHPGFKAHRVLDSVLPGARQEIARMIRDSIASDRSD